MTEQEALLILNAIPGLGNIRIPRLIAYFGSAVNVLRQKGAGLAASGIVPGILAQKIFDFQSDRFLKSEYNLLAKHGVGVLTVADAGYSQRLREIPDAPVVLYQKGKWDGVLPAVGIVGSRRASIYGLQVARRFSSRLAEAGITIVSGLARGIDAAAHEGCLKARGTTVAVLGSGLAQIYPSEHARLASRVAESGAVISEFPMTMPPLGVHFPRRNRIISGLSLGIVVVEAAQKSGALITTTFALEQGREVFAVPGPIDSPNSHGVHDLIQQGAKLTTRPEDVLEELAPQLKNFLRPMSEEKTAVPPQPPLDGLAADETVVLEKLGDQPTYLDEVLEETGLARQRALTAVVGLELKQWIRQLPGNYFLKVKSES